MLLKKNSRAHHVYMMNRPTTCIDCLRLLAIWVAFNGDIYVKGGHGFVYWTYVLVRKGRQKCSENLITHL